MTFSIDGVGGKALQGRGRWFNLSQGHSEARRHLAVKPKDLKGV